MKTYSRTMSDGNVARTAQVVGSDKPLRIKTIAMPDLPPDMVRINVAYAGICHSDLHLIDEADSVENELGIDRQGMVLGHEISGIVEEIGKDVQDNIFAIGDDVIVCPWKGCCQCEACKIGQNNQCTNNPAGKEDIGQSVNHPGGYQSHINVHPDFLLKVRGALPLDVACMLPCSASTVYSLLKKLEKFLLTGAERSGSTARLLVIGAGGLGLWAITLAKAMFNNVHITVADIDQSKLGLAKESGADDVLAIDRKASPEESKDLMTKTGMYCAVIDLVGSSSTAKIAVSSLQTGGAMVLVGLFGGNFNCPLSMIISKSITLFGHRTAARKDTAEMMKLAIEKKLNFPKLQYIDHDNINNALEDLVKGRIHGRCLIKY